MTDMNQGRFKEIKNFDYETCLDRNSAIEELDNIRKELIEQVEQLQMDSLTHTGYRVRPKKYGRVL